MSEHSKPDNQKALNRIFVGGLIGFIGGFIIGLILNPPFEGMTKTASDVQGLTIFSWVFYGFIASIFGAILSMFGTKKRKTIKEKGSNNRVEFDG